jgi:hypothetical protein
MEEPDFIVFRAAPGVPEGMLGHWDGLWFDLNDVPHPSGVRRDHLHMILGMNHWDVFPCGEFEVRNDGAVAEVWRMHLGEH